MRGPSIHRGDGPRDPNVLASLALLAVIELVCIGLAACVVRWLTN